MTEKKKILIVEDDQINMTFLVEILQGDYELELAYSGVESLKKMDNYIPDLILLDIMMAEMDGYELCRLVKNNDKLKDVKVLFISARAMQADREMAMNVGGDGFLAKPFEVVDLLDKIDELIS